MTRFDSFKDQEVVAASIDANQSLGNLVNLGGLRLAAVDFPADWHVGTTTVSFVGSRDGTTDLVIENEDGSEYTIAAEPGRSVPVNVPLFFSFQFLKVRGGTSASPTSHTSARNLSLVAAGV